MIEAVVFDFDGTLVNVPIDYESLFREFIKIMKTKEVHPLTKTVSQLDEKRKKEVFDAWDKAELAVLADITIVDEGIAVYRKFLTKPKALVTMQGKALLQNVLKRFDLSFNFIVTRENSLGRTEQLKMASEQLKTSPKNILFVGNTDEDAREAEKVGCQFLRVKK